VQNSPKTPSRFFDSRSLVVTLLMPPLAAAAPTLASPVAIRLGSGLVQALPLFAQTGPSASIGS
jgi:hypothetical protein